MQRDLVFLPIDKAANNIGFVCKRLYHFILAKELRENQAYKRKNMNVSEVLDKHRKTLGPAGLMGKPTLGYMYWNIKFHKTPPGRRFISSFLQCSLTLLSKALVPTLSRIMMVLRNLSDELFATTGVRRYFIVDSYEEVANSIHLYKRMPGQKTSLYTGDFSEMYTNIPQHKIMEQIRWCVDKAWDHRVVERNRTNDDPIEKKHLFLQVQPPRIPATGTYVAEWCVNKARMRRKGGSEKLLWSREKLLDYVQFLIQNTYIQNGEEIHQQVNGIPIGVHPAPQIANLFCLAYEWRYIDRLLRVVKQRSGETAALAQARYFAYMFRLIDDVLSIDNPLIGEASTTPAPENLDGDELGGIYPLLHMSLNNTSVSPTEVNFLGIRILDVAGTLELSIYDKRRDFTFEVKMYPHMDSNIPEGIPYGVFISLLVRRGRIISTWRGFLQESILVAKHFIKQGARPCKLKDKFRRYMSIHAYTAGEGLPTILAPLTRWKTTSNHLVNLFNRSL
jgi:hypothetical protein